MTTTTVKLQVPIDRSVRDKWDRYAKRHGFDSLQAYIRFLAKADVDGRRVNLEESVRLSETAETRYAREIAEHEAARRGGKAKMYTDTKSLMRDLLEDNDEAN